MLFRRKKNQRLNTAPYRPRRKSAFQLSVRASVHDVRARAWWQFQLNREYASKFGRVTHPKSRPRARARDTVIKFRTTLPRSVKNLLLRPERGCKKKRSLNNDPPPSYRRSRRKRAEHPGINTRECIFQSYANRYLFLVHYRKRRFVCIKAVRRQPSS